MDTTIYSDGNGTKVTTHEFVTRDGIYLVQGIIDARMSQMKFSAVPSVFCIVTGLLSFILGAFHLLHAQPHDNFYIGSLVLTPNRIAALLGAFFVFCGIIGLMTRHKKYTVHIVTAEGERDALTSEKKIYIRRIVLAIRRALKSQDTGLARYWLK